MPTAQGTRGPVKVLKRPSSPSLEAKTVSTRRNVHKISPPKAFLACNHGPRVGEEEGGGWEERGGHEIWSYLYSNLTYPCNGGKHIKCFSHCHRGAVYTGPTTNIISASPKQKSSRNLYQGHLYYILLYTSAETFGGLVRAWTLDVFLVRFKEGPSYYFRCRT